MTEIELRDRDSLLNQIYLEAPIIGDDATGLLVNMCDDTNMAPIGIKLLTELVVRKPPKQLKYLNALLCLTIHNNDDVRDKAIESAVAVYKHSEVLANQVEDRAGTFMNYLTLPNPPDQLFGVSIGRPEIIDSWNDDLNRVCLYLYLGLLPVNEVLIHDLSRVYIQTSAETKRTILRLLEAPVRIMGIESKELLRLVETCPKGSETLVTKVIHILTEKNPPSAELVARVRDLYQSRVPDVRFIIPVLNGLSKKEIIAALPKLIKLNPMVVKEVFNKLLNNQIDGRLYASAITPAELLVALHTIDSAKVELKFAVKATSLCFAEKEAYTQEVLAVVMQQLMEISPLPTLLMRTVLQSLSLYPRLSGFVMNILQRLILKQVWKQKLVWDGFLKCCQRTKPQSLQVLLQLPAQQLTEALQMCPDLRAPLEDHVNNFSENQRAHVSQALLEIILGPTKMDDSNSVLTEIKTESTFEIPTNLLNEPVPPGME